jgi:hypothetical protein
MLPLGCSSAPQGSPGASIAADADTADRQTCGGFIGRTCREGFFCKFSGASACGVADAEGVCTKILPNCPRILEPVCGCDGNDYSNACEANAAGVNVAQKGSCDTQTPPPGNGKCGGLAAFSCDAGQYCEFELGCGAGDQEGTCKAVPQACTRELAPVCGCDDNTYSNSCEAHAAGVSVAKKGACESEEKKCVRAGCSGQLCMEEGQPGGITTCEFLPQYGCYHQADCARQANGECGFTVTDTLMECLGQFGITLPDNQ